MTTLIIGASPNKQRYSYKAIQKLRKLNTLKGPIHHPIYGKMKSEQVIFLIIHHTTHHCNQFGLI